MDNALQKNPQNMAWWIISLAISIVCCAILFVVFASYLVNIKEDIAVSKIRMDMSEQRITSLASEIESLRHRGSVQQIQILPTGGGGAEGVVNIIRGGQNGQNNQSGDVPAPTAAPSPPAVAPAPPAKP